MTATTDEMTSDEFAAELEEWADSVDPADLEPIDVTCLHRIAALAERRGAAKTAAAAVEDEIAAAVQEARAVGHGWGVIGLYLGVSRQAAHKRYANRDRGARAAPAPA